MKKNFLNFAFIGILGFLMIGLNSCDIIDDDIIFPPDDENDGGDDGGDNGGDYGDDCYELSFPLDVVVWSFDFPTDSTSTDTVIVDEYAIDTVTVNNQEELDALYNGEGDAYFYDHVYPFDVTITETGEVVTINNHDDLCYVCYDDGNDDDDDGDDGDDGEEECFELVFPLDVLVWNWDGSTDTTNSEGTVITVNSQAELDDAYSGQNGSFFMDYVYPFDVVMIATGDVVTVTDAEAYWQLYDACEEELNDSERVIKNRKSGIRTKAAYLQN